MWLLGEDGDGVEIATTRGWWCVAIVVVAGDCKGGVVVEIEIGGNGYGGEAAMEVVMARNLFPPLDNPELTIQTRSRSDPTLLNNSEMAAEGNGDLPVPDLRTMEELCQPSLNGRGGLIAPIAIQATNFGLKNDMIQQVQNSCQFHGLPGDDASKHLEKFLHVTQSIKVNGVTDDALRLYLFPYSFTHHATAWFDRLPRNSINTFEQMTKMFLGKYFPPSTVTKLRNEITNFRQHLDESLFEAWERYKLSIDRCPNHNMLPVTQIDTFYNSLTLRHRDTINATIGGTFLNRHIEECYDLIKNMTAHHNNWDTSAQRSESSSSINSSSDTEIIELKAEMAEINKNLMRVLQVNQQVKAVTPNCETCGGPHFFSDCPATIDNTLNVMLWGRIKGANQGQNQPQAYQAPAYQAPVYQASIHQPQIPRLQVVTTNEFTNFMKANDAILKNMQTNMTSLTNSNLELINMFGQFIKMNTASSLGLGTLLGNRLTNPKEDLKGITTRNETAYPGPMIPTSSSPVVERETEATKDTSLSIVRFLIRLGFAEDVFIKVGTFHFSADLVVVDFDADLRVSLILGRSFLKTERALIDLFKGELTLRVGKEAITFNLNQTSRYSANYNDMTANRINVIDMACEEYSSQNDPISPKVDQSYLDSEGDILLLEAFLNDGPSLPLPNQGNYMPEVRKELKICDAKSDKSSIDEPPEVELKDLPPHIEYAFLEGDDKLPVIITKDLSIEEKTALITVLKSHKRAIAWKVSDIKRIDLKFCTHKILMEEDFEPVAQHQRRVNPKIHDVIKQEGGFTIVEIEENELILTRLVMRWRVCIDYRTFQRCMMAIFHDMIKKTIEVFMDDFSIFGNSFQTCLSHLEKMLKRCEDTNLCLNWEKSHFMVKEGIVLSHKISKEGIEVDKAKVDVISKLPHPKNVKGIRSFLCHPGFYRRKLTKALILIAPDWNKPFELMCDPSNFAIGAVLGQRQENHFRPIHNASKTMTDAESNYTIMEKEMLAVVYAFENFWSYLIMNKSIVYTDHFTLKYLFSKKDSKENSLIYKEKTKRLHDSKIKGRVFNIGDRVLLFNSRLNIFSGKLKSRWFGPLTISHVFPYGTVELSQPDGPNFKVNGHRLKHYFGEDVPKMVFPDLQTFPKDH
nr:reverse transcriptase domain-containing protein [Tanacetum cinerariifolium]